MDGIPYNIYRHNFVGFSWSFILFVGFILWTHANAMLLCVFFYYFVSAAAATSSAIKHQFTNAHTLCVMLCL